MKVLLRRLKPWRKDISSFERYFFNSVSHQLYFNSITNFWGRSSYFVHMMYFYLSIFRQLNHQNLVQLYGIVTKKKPLIIVTELMQYGKKKKKKIITLILWLDIHQISNILS